MYFQVTPPPRLKPLKKSTTAAADIVSITLAPFTPNVKVLFEDIHSHTKATRQVVVRNPSVQDIEVNITKLPPEDRHVQLAWTKIMIPSNSEEILSIHWIPIEKGTWLDTVSFEWGRRLRKDLHLVFKSVTNKGSKIKRTGTRKSPVSVVLKRVKSPIKTYTSKKILSLNNKENDLYVSSVQKFSSPSTITFNISDADGQFGRHTYLVDKPRILANTDNTMTSPLHILNENKGFSPSESSSSKKSQYLLTSDICSNMNAMDNLSNISTETYTMDTELKNISSETYIKSSADVNLSHGTYVNTNISDITEDSLEEYFNSFEISLKALQACSNETQLDNVVQTNITTPHGCDISDSSVKKHLNLESSGVKDAVEANLWSNHKSRDNFDGKSGNHLCTPFRPRASSSGNRKRKSDTVFKVSPIKKLNNTCVYKTWSKIGVAKKVGKVPLQRPSVKELFKVQKEEIELIRRIRNKAAISHNTEHFLSTISTLNSANVALNPFVTTTYIYDPQWLDEQEECFKRWFNVLLVPHSELKTYSESVDVARVWQQCLRKEVTKAPTKEEVSQQYHVNTRLDSLRKAAMDLYKSSDIVIIINKVLLYVQTGRLEIRRDRNVHQDISLQYEITRLFLSYNSLWLQIGLETVFGKMIPLRSNSDSIGLMLFVKDHVFKDNYLLRKYKTVQSSKYCVDIKKHFLNKFLAFVFFLDQAKLRKLIPHDPCLFVKSGEFKESREILLHFAKEVIASIGDITRFLKPSRYVLSYKQTYIHEFDYAVDHLAGDLRDGVRLAKIMEIILLQQGLTEVLRVPAISRLQKIYNVKVSFDALEKSGFHIMEDITPVDIVNGHKEKTLTFLWQIVNKFQLPRFTKAALTIQQWFKSLNIVIRRKNFAKKWLVKEQAARVIQTWYRKQLSSRLSFREKRYNAATKIQSFYKMWRTRNLYIKLRQFAITVQSKYRMLVTNQQAQRKLSAIVTLQAFIRGHLQRKRFSSLRAAVMIIENHYIAKKVMLECRTYYKTLKSFVILLEEKFLARKAMKTVRKEFLIQKHAAITIQTAFKSYLVTRKMRIEYLHLKNATIYIQCTFKGNKLMKQHRTYYNQLRTATINIQNRWRANQLMKHYRAEYHYKIKCIICIQQRLKAYLCMKSTRVDYLNKRNAIKLIQRKFRSKKSADVERKEYLRKVEAVKTIQVHFIAHLRMLKQRKSFLSLKSAVLKIQNRYRALKLMQKQRTSYLSLKELAIKIQRRRRAQIVYRRTLHEYQKLKKSVICIQRLFRANGLMKNDRRHFLDMKNASITIQHRFRAIILMREQRLSFLQIVYSASLIQNYYRFYKLTLATRMEYCDLKTSVVNIQRRIRANNLMKGQRSKYLHLIETVRSVQQRYRAQMKMRTERRQYLALNKATKMLQSRFRSRKAMQQQQMQFLKMKQSVLIIQRRYRATALMHQQKISYQRAQSSVLKIQRYYRSYKETEKIRMYFCQLKRSVINIQRRFRANQLMKDQRSEYLRLLVAAKIIQRRYKAQIAMRNERTHYTALKSVAEMIQSKYRARIAMRHQLKQFHHLKQCTIFIQLKYRAIQLMKQQRTSYLSLYTSVVKVQRYYRSFKLSVETRNNYYQTRKAVLNIQRRFRANVLMKTQRSEYLLLLHFVKIVQERYRAQIKMRYERNRYIALTNAVRILQTKYRAKLSMRRQLEQFKHLKECTILIQRKFRATMLMRHQKCSYQHNQNCIVQIQRWFRLCKISKKMRFDFCHLKKAAIIIQRRYRAHQLMKIQRTEYLQLVETIIYIQRKFKAQNKMRIERQLFLQNRCAAVKIQQYYRSCKEMQRIKSDYYTLRSSIVVIQRYFRAYKLMKKQRFEYILLIDAVKTVQEKYRAQILMRVQRDHYCRLKTITENLQSRYRATKSMKIERDQFLQLRQACLFTQQRFRSIQLMNRERNVYVQLKRFVLYVEAKYEAKLLARKGKYSYQLLRGTIIGLQTFSRGYLVRKRYSYIFDEEYRARHKEELKKTSAAQKIQALWRGFRTRSEKNVDIQTIQKLRQRRKVLNKTAVNTLTLGERKKAVLQGMARNSFLQIITSLKDLDHIARHSKDSCASFCTLLPDVLYQITIASKRSISDKEAIELATSLIITLCKFSPNNQNTYQVQHLDRMLTVMIHWCDKESQVFLNIATLFWLFAQNKKHRRNILALPNLRHRLIKIKDLIERKIKMVMKGQRPQQSVFAEIGNIGQLYLPYLYPDWGLNYAHRPHAFTNIKHALQTLLQTLDTPY